MTGFAGSGNSSYFQQQNQQQTGIDLLRLLGNQRQGTGINISLLQDQSANWSIDKDFVRQKRPFGENRAEKLRRPHRHKPTRQSSHAWLSEQSINIIGENGQRRFEEFIKYPDGWAGGQGKPLSFGSVNLLELFLQDLPELAEYHPSLFLSYQGNLQLGWEDKSGSDVEIEFFPNKLEYFLESLHEEAEVSRERMLDLIEKVRSLLT